MNLVAVDLAAKFSAACWLDDTMRVINQWDSWQRSQRDFINLITGPFIDPRRGTPSWLVIEDLPARVPFMTVVRDVCRLQGRIAHCMDNLDALDRIVLVQPATWKAHFSGLERGTPADAVLDVAEEQYGYTPPPLAHRCVKRGDKAHARKVATDYAAAYLIGRWAHDHLAAHGHLNAPRTSRYVT